LDFVVGWQRRLGVRGVGCRRTSEGFIDGLLRKYFSDQVSVPVIG
jgi:hypothetical protein